MISILDPRALIAAIALCAASVGIGYWRGNVAGKASVQAAWNQERAEQAAIVAQAASADATARLRTTTANAAVRLPKAAYLTLTVKGAAIAQVGKADVVIGGEWQGAA